MHNPLMDDPVTDVSPHDGDASVERMWPLDISLAVLGGLVIYTVASRLEADDPRLLYNPWTYAVAVPLLVVATSLVLRNVASRFVRRSLQLGFLFSVMVHLLLLITFVNVMIFAPFWPSATSGDQPIRAPLRKTLPDYLFARSDLPQKQPDWSRPLDAMTTSRSVPEHQRILPPLDAAAEQLEMARDQPPRETVDRPSLTPRPLRAAAMPAPSSSAAELSRQPLRREPSIQSTIEVPDLPLPTPDAAGAVERAIEMRPLVNASPTAASLSNSGSRPPELPQFAATPAADLPRIDRAMPGMPQITAGGLATVVPSSQDRMPVARSLPPGALGAPDLSAIRVARDRGESGAGDTPSQPMATDRAAALDALAAGSGRTRGDASGVDPSALKAPSAAALDLTAPNGPAGLSADPARRVGSALAEQMPEVSSIDFGPPADRRIDLGGPVAPAGADIAGLRPFDRRTMRTSGGAAPTPAGMVGPEVEKAIELGLAYLAERQNADGSWSLQGHGEDVIMRSDTAATGLCLLAFQGAGYTHRQHQYADTVARGLEFLVRHQRANGDLYRPEDLVSNRNAWLYSHGIAALALCEAYGMTRDEELREPAQRCIDFIALSQDPRFGGWRYQPRQSSDTSVTGWMMMALKSGELSGLNVPEETYEGIDQWMDAAQEGPLRPARYRYNPFAPLTPEQAHGRRVTPTMTAVGLLARLYLGWERNQEEMQRGADYLAQFPPTHGTPQDPQRDTYYWYYATQVMFHMGGEHWEQWNRRLSPLLSSTQLVDGPDAGSWDPKGPIPDRWAPHAGRLYVTAMNLLSLEVYYRHLPIYVQTAK